MTVQEPAKLNIVEQYKQSVASYFKRKPVSAIGNYTILPLVAFAATQGPAGVMALFTYFSIKTVQRAIQIRNTTNQDRFLPVVGCVAGIFWASTLPFENRNAAINQAQASVYKQLTYNCSSKAEQTLNYDQGTYFAWKRTVKQITVKGEVHCDSATISPAIDSYYKIIYSGDLHHIDNYHIAPKNPPRPPAYLSDYQSANELTWK